MTRPHVSVDMTTISPGAATARDAARQDDGRFGTQIRTPPGDAEADGADYDAILDRTMARVHAMQESPLGSQETHGLQLKAAAAAVRAVYPTATKVHLETSDQEGCENDRVIGSITDSSGASLGPDEGCYPDLGDYEGDVVVALYELPDRALGDSSACSDIDRRRGTATFDVDQALAYELPEQAPADRAQTLVRSYAALHGDPDDGTDPAAQEARAARAVLADLRAWAASTGTDLEG